jgi:hypothetical protein
MEEEDSKSKPIGNSAIHNPVVVVCDPWTFSAPKGVSCLAQLIPSNVNLYLITKSGHHMYA